MKFMVKTFPTIWALGWWRLVSFNNKVIEFKIFLGPFVFTWWR